MKFLFLSDLHLGSPLFESAREIISLLDKDYDRVFILGDIIDEWEDDVESIVADNKSVIDKINELDNVVVIKGNHDPTISELKVVFPNKEVIDCYELNYDGKSMIIMHGEEFDHLITNHSWLARLVFPFYWCCERLGFNLKGCLRQLFHSIFAKIEKKHYNDLVLDTEENLVNKYKDKYDYIVVGHTHLPKLVKGTDFTYINCGDWIYHKSYVEYEDGQFKLIEL